MRTKLTIIIIVAVLVGLGVFIMRPNEKESAPSSNKPPQKAPDQSFQAQQGPQSVTKTKPMKITSPAFANQESIPEKYTCTGEDVNPPLEFSDVPEDTKALALIVDDPDAPGKTWVHWTVWNISPDTTGIAEDSVPEDAQQGMTDFGKTGYGGPCPPSGEHRYFFKLYALDTELDLASDAGKQGLEGAMEGHILAQDELMGVYAK